MLYSVVADIVQKVMVLRYIYVQQLAIENPRGNYNQNFLMN